MTQCIKILKKSKTLYKIHQYTHNNSTTSYGDEAAQKLGTNPEMVYKTLVVTTDTKEFAVGIVPVASKLSMKLIAKSLGVKKASMADAIDVEKVSGYVLGGVSPIGQKKRLRTIVDSSASNLSTVFVSAGKRGLEVELNPKDLVTLIDARFENITL